MILNKIRKISCKRPTNGYEYGILLSTIPQARVAQVIDNISKDALYYFYLMKITALMNLPAG